MEVLPIRMVRLRLTAYSHVQRFLNYILFFQKLKLRLNEDATTEFQKAVAASVSEIMGWFDDDTDASAYASSLGTPTLQKVFEQKYIAQAR